MFGWVRKMLAPKEGPAGVLGGIQRSMTDPPKRGTLEHLQVFEVSPRMQAAARLVANAVACCDFDLYKKRVGGQVVRDARLQKARIQKRAKLMEAARPDVEEVLTHPFLDALDKPNPFMNRHTLLKVSQYHWDFVGDVFWLKDRNALGVVVGYWPIPPHWVMETPRPDKPTFRFGYRSWQATVPASEVAWDHDPTPANPYTRGTGIGWALADEIQVDEYVSKMAAALFFNRARPDFVFATGLGADETRRVEQDWTQRNQGFFRWFKPYFIHGEPGAIDLQKQIREFQQPTMEQLVYPNLRNAERDIMWQTWGVSPELFGAIENSNRATVDAALYHFQRLVVLPRAERWRSFLQQQMEEDFDERGIIHCESPVEEDKEYRLTAAKTFSWALTLDEARAFAGLAPVGNGVGGARMIPLANYLTNDPLNLDARPKGGGPSLPAGEPKEEDPPKEPAEAVRALVLDTLRSKVWRSLPPGEVE